MGIIVWIPKGDAVARSTVIDIDIPYQLQQSRQQISTIDSSEATN